MEVDVHVDDAGEGTSTDIEPVLRTGPHVASGRFTCIICFQSCTSRRKKAAGMQEIGDVANFRARAELWTEYAHEYSSVFSKVDWSSKKLHVHRNCRSAFFKENVMSRQKRKQSQQSISTEDVQEDVAGTESSELPTSSRRRSTRHEHAYSSSLSSPSCIVCCGVKYDPTTRAKIQINTMDRKREDSRLHEVERSMREFATVHVKLQTKAHLAAAERIQLLLGVTGTLFDQNVGFHVPCYKSFTSGHFKTSLFKSQPTPHACMEELVDEFITLVDQVVVRKKEVYTLRQLRELWADIRGVDISSVRAIDVKNLLQEQLSSKIQFCKSSQIQSSTSSEYVLSSDVNILPDAIHSIVTGEGITNHLQLKAIARKISDDIQSHPTYPWPPTPQDIVECDDLIDKRLHNIISWIVSPNSHMGRDGYVNLSTRKSTKVNEICQTIQSLVPGGNHSLSQILLSLSMYGKTGSKNIVNDLRHLGHGIPYTETLFIMDKWAEWCVNQQSLVPSTIRKGIPTTHVFDNIDWKNKNIQRTESHYTNSILVQKYDLSNQLSKVSLEPDYSSERKNHRSFKTSETELAPVTFKRGNPKKLKYTPLVASNESTNSSLKTLAWCLLRLNGPGLVPSWSGFQEITSEHDLEQAVVGYLPPVAASPTEMRVIYTEIERTELIRCELELDYIFLEVDQAIYTKVLDSMFKLKDDGKDYFQRIIPRMGGFHITKCMLCTIYSLFNKIGIVQVLSASGLGGLGTVQKCLKGGDVNEGINLHKKMFEALIQTKIEYLNSNTTDQIVSRDAIFENFARDMSSTSFSKVVDSGIVKLLPKLKGDMPWLIDLYLEMVDMLLNFIHFLRTGNWQGYLEIIFQFLPYCFSLNRHNYARNLTYYYVHMLSLKEDLVSAWDYLNEGGFTGSITSIPHSRLPFDHIIETTLNKECKGIGGIGGNTENLGATERWVRVNHFMAAMREKMDQKVRKRTKRKHADLGLSRMRRDMHDVGHIKSTIDSWLPQLWSSDTPITNMSSGMKATEEMRDDIVDIKQRGETARDDFMRRFTTDSATETYYDPIKRQDLKLFKKVKQKKRPTIAEDESQSLTEILILYDQKKLNLKHFMSWCLFNRPWMFVKEDETSRESRKSVFRNHLQSLSPNPPSSVEPRGIGISIVDAMRVVRLIPISGLQIRTFRCWAERIARYLLAIPGKEIHVLFDNYNYTHNIPSKNRVQSSIERTINSLDQELPPVSEWSDFLRNSHNKFQLANLLADFFLNGGLPGKVVYANKESKCFYKNNLVDDPIPFPELNSNHREADQKIPMHAVYVGQSQNQIICVVADDSDIYLSLLFVCHRIPVKLYFRQGKSTDKAGITYHDVSSLAEKLGVEVCLIILCFHALTGSDFTFAFYYRSKITVFRKMLKTKDSWKLLRSLSTVHPNIEDVTRYVLYIVYNRPLREKSLGEARYNVLKTRKKDSLGKKVYPSSKSLPPDQSSLKMKILRSTFTAHCMTNCLDPNYVPLDPSSYGWSLKEGLWEPVWYEGSPLPHPDEVEENEPEVNDESDDEAIEEDQEFSSDSEYAGSCSDSDNDSDPDFDDH